MTTSLSYWCNQVKEDETYAITWLIRRLFRSMAEHSNTNLESFGISAADRAVLEFLYPGEALSVPEIAEQYDVSRQHVQVTVNRLADKGLVKTTVNPRHKKSSLITLTKTGTTLFAKVLKRDKRTIDRLFSGLPQTNITVTKRTLAALYERLQEGDY